MRSKTTEKPSFNALYVLKFPRYYTTWRLSKVDEDGFFYFLTSLGQAVAKMSLSRFNFLCSKYLVDTVSFQSLGIESTTFKERVSLSVEKKSAFRSKEYTKEESNVYDDIDDIEF